MVNWMMKNLFINTALNANNFKKLKNCANFYFVHNENWTLPETSEQNTNFAIIDADLNCDLNLFINTYKKYNTKFFAFTKDTSKENVLKLYSLGVNNVVPTPQNLEEYILNIINPDNKDVTINDIQNYCKTKKTLLLSDNQINTNLLIEALNEFEFVYTIRPVDIQAKNDIQKDKYDLIILDYKDEPEYLFEIIQTIINSKLNKNTPVILLSNALDTTIKLNEYGLFEYYYIEKPYKPQILQTQIKNILKIKDLQEELKRENSLLDSMITNSYNQLIITDSNFIILGGGNQHIQISKNEYFFNILSSLNINFPQEEIRTFSRTSQKEIKFCITDKEKNYEVVISKVFKDNEVFEQYLIVIEDITEKLLLEEQKETFIATLTHDLKSPLRAEQNIIKQLLDERFGMLTEEQKMILQEILNSKDYENKMIDNLLTRYHLTSESFKLFIENNDYKDTIEKVISEINYLFENKKQTIEFNYSAKSQIFEFDKTEVKRILLNLLQNATEYTPKNGHITITVNDTESEITTSIEDNGYGIKSENIEHIFDKNVTLAKKYRKVGAGLGLYICKTLINAHKGDIKVESELNKGTKFTFTLPKIQ